MPWPECHLFPHPPRVCTEMYEPGDFCREFVRCENINGTCHKVESSEFAECVSCVRACQERKDPQDPAVVFMCEYECRKKFE